MKIPVHLSSQRIREIITTAKKLWATYSCHAPSHKNASAHIPYLSPLIDVVHRSHTSTHALIPSLFFLFGLHCLASDYLPPRSRSTLQLKIYKWKQILPKRFPPNPSKRFCNMKGDERATRKIWHLDVWS